MATRAWIGKKWHAVYQKEILKKTDYENADFDEIREKIDIKFDDFIEKDLKDINLRFKKGRENKEI